MTGRHRSRVPDTDIIGCVALSTMAVVVAVFAAIVLADYRFSAIVWFVAALLATAVLVGWCITIAVIVGGGANLPRWLALGIPPLLIAVMIGVAAAGWPYQARWALDEDDFIAAVREIESGIPVARYAGSEMGTRSVTEVFVIAEGQLILFKVGGALPMGCDEHGFGYAGEELDPATLSLQRPLHFTRLGNGWWRYQLCGMADGYV